MADGDRAGDHIGELRPKGALYREWRPKTFGDVVEQAHVVKTLKNSILHNRLAHAYLFCGTRGTGKTTLAQILSRAVNCLNPKDAEPCNECEICMGILSGRVLDVAEIDAASNNSVDNIRNLREDVVYAPAQAKYKVYIIDEVHMLSGGAFNALLKTLEEPPPYVLFILATTEPHKLPATIISRCQRFDFRRISDEAIVERLGHIADSIGISADREALSLIAKLSEGAMRDAISIFDQCASAGIGGADGADGEAGMGNAGRGTAAGLGGAAYGSGAAHRSGADAGKKRLTLDGVLRVTGCPDDENLVKCARAIMTHDVKAVPGYAAEAADAGMNLLQYLDSLIGFFRNMLMIKLGHGRESFPEISPGTFAEIIELVRESDADIILAIITELAAAAGLVKASSNQSVILEVTLAKISLGRFSSAGAIESLNARIAMLEKRIEGLQAAISGDGAGVSLRQPEKSADIARTERQQADAIRPAEAAQPADAAVTARLQADAIRPAEAAQPADAAVTERQQADAIRPADAAQAADAVAMARQQADAIRPADAAHAAQPAQPVEPINWNRIVTKFKTTGNPALFSILLSASAEIINDCVYVILSKETAPLSGLLQTPDNAARLRTEIQSATGKPYRVQVVAGRESLPTAQQPGASQAQQPGASQAQQADDNVKTAPTVNEIAKTLNEKFNIPANIYP